MMNDRFFRSYLNQQPSRPVSVQQTERRSSPKVVSVPVHFISSDQPQTTISMLKESAAIKIQRAFRGFLVRKSVKKIASIRNEVSEIERRINDIEVVDLIRRDAKERLKVNETLMSCLFKLDSILGVDCGVRDLRKAVTKKAIALQEKVDSIGQTDHQTLDSTSNDSGEIDSSEQVPVIPDSHDEVDHSRNSEAVEDDEEIVVKVDSIGQTDHQTLDSTGNDSGEIDSSEQVPEIPDSHDEVDHSRNSEAVEDAEEIVVKEVVKEIVEDCCDHAKGADEKEDRTSVNSGLELQKDDEKINRELLEKLMDDNEKMMKLMTQVLERNEMQNRMINSLSGRVKQLEKTFVSTDKPRKKKKRHLA